MTVSSGARIVAPNPSLNASGVALVPWTYGWLLRKLVAGGTVSYSGGADDVAEAVSVLLVVLVGAASATAAETM